MSKLPYIPLYTGDWLKDPSLSICAPAARGVWMDLLCAMHEAGRLGELRGTIEQLARVARCSTAELVQALTELQATGAAIVKERNGIYSVVNRRMKREAELREKATARQRAARSRRVCVTPEDTGCNESGRKYLDPTGEGCHEDDVCLSQRSSSSVSSSISKPSSSSESIRETSRGIGESRDDDEDQSFLSWEKISSRLSQLKLNDVRTLVRNARDNLLTPDHVNAIIDHWSNSKGGWPIGGLHWRISNGAPNQHPSDGWPPKKNGSVTLTPEKHEAAKRAKRQQYVEAIRRRLITDGENDARNWDDEKVIARAQAKGMIE